MIHKGKRSSLKSGLMKLMVVLFFVCHCFSIKGQNMTTRDSNLQVTNPTWVKDTSKAGKPWLMLGFSINVQDPAQLRSLSVDFLDEKEMVVSDLGVYELKSHPGGFYYLENNRKEKKNLYNNTIYFTKKIDSATSKRVKKIRVNYLDLTNKKKSSSVLCHE